MDLLAGYGSDSSSCSINSVDLSPTGDSLSKTNIETNETNDVFKVRNGDLGKIDANDQNSVIQNQICSSPMLVEEEQRRKEETYVNISSDTTMNETIYLSSEYGEHGIRKFLTANSAQMIGRNEDDNVITIGRKSVIEQEVVLRADLESINVGQMCFIGRRTLLRPPWRINFANNQRQCEWSKMVIGSHVHCGRDCVVESFAIGSFVRIGDGCILGKHTVIKDCCLICPGSILPDYMVVPPFTIVQGAPARIVGELPESALEEYRDLAERNCRSRVFTSTPS